MGERYRLIFAYLSWCEWLITAQSNGREFWQCVGIFCELAFFGSVLYHSKHTCYLQTHQAILVGFVFFGKEFKFIESKNKKVSHNVIAREHRERSNLDSKNIESKAN